MTPLAVVNLWEDNPLGVILYGFVLLGGALVGGLLAGLLGKYSALLFWKELSTRSVLLLRLFGGVGGALLAYSLIGTGDGWGFGPGAGGWPGRGPGDGKGQEMHPVSLIDKQRDPSQERVPAADKDATVRLVILGPETKPPYEEPDRFFQIVGVDSPRALTVGETIDRLRTMRQERSLQAVALEVTNDSTVLARPHVHTLRSRILNELQLPFSQPDFDGNALKDRRHYKPGEMP